MKIYLAIKYHPDSSNRALVEAITEHLKSNGGHEVFCVARDLEQWGQKSFEPKDLMQRSFQLLETCELVLVELTEKGVGLGIEAGFAYARGIPIQVVALNGSDFSTTLTGIATSIQHYSKVSQIRISKPL